MAEFAPPLDAAATAPSQSLMGPAVQMALGLLVILGVILLAYWMLRRFGPRLGLGRPVSAHGLAIESQLHLGPKKSIMVVRFLNKLLVLGVTEQSINLLTEVDQSHDQSDFQAALDNARSAEDSPGACGHVPDTGPGSGGPGPA